MDQTRWNRIEELLQAALDLDTAERLPFLRKACGSDVELHCEVTAILAGASEGLFLETPAMTAVAVEAPQWPLTGRIGHYRIESRIGAGGMGEVYRAHDERLRRTVALKALPMEFMTDAGRLQRFEREAVAASQLNHPNIITIHETLTASGVHLIATEYVEGQTLRELLTNPVTSTPRKLPIEVALDIAVQAAAALKAAHTAWIIHRDIKPENIMLRADGLVKVLDFGIAKLSEEASDDRPIAHAHVPADGAPPPSTLTVAGAVLGTSSYMSPEQARGAPLDGRTDIFSLGVVLYEMVAGERPGELDQLPHGIPKPLQRLLRKMLQPDREQRHASTAELHDELRKVQRRLDGRRARRLIAASAFTAIAAIALTAVAALMSVNEVWDERVMRDGHTAAARQAVVSPDGRLIASCGEDGHIIIWDFARRQRVATLDYAAHSVAFAPDGRSFVSGGLNGTVAVWDPATWRKVRILKMPDRTEVTALAFSPDGNALAVCTFYKLSMWDARRWEKVGQWNEGASWAGLLFSADSRQLISTFGFVVLDPLRKPVASLTEPFGNAIARSPDGTRFALVNSWGVVAVSRVPPGGDLTQTVPLWRQRAHQDHGRSVAFSPDGRLLASASEDIVVWDAATHQKIARFEYSSIVWNVVFSPDGRWLISSHGDGAVLIWDVAERALVANLNEHSGAVRSVAFDPRGKTLASGGEDRTVMLWDVDSGRKRSVLMGHQTRVTAVAYSPDGTRFGSIDQDGVVILWNLAARQPGLIIRRPDTVGYCLAMTADGARIATTHGVFTSDGQLLRPYGYEHGSTYGVAFSRDGRYLATVNDNSWVNLWDAETLALIEQVHAGSTPQIAVDFSPDGKTLVTGTNEGEVQLWSVSPLRKIGVLGRHRARVKSIAFSPAGDVVASAGDDKMIALWDVRRRALRARVGTHTSPIYAVAFSADGRQLASGEHDRSVRVYTRRRELWGFQLD